MTNHNTTTACPLAAEADRLRVAADEAAEAARRILLSPDFTPARCRALRAERDEARAAYLAASRAAYAERDARAERAEREAVAAQPFPITLAWSKGCITEFAESEFASHEDTLHRREEGSTDAEDLRPTVYEILSRLATRVRLENADEVAVVWWALCSGTFQLSAEAKCGEYSYLAAADRFADRLRPYVEIHAPAYAARYAGPTGF